MSEPNYEHQCVKSPRIIIYRITVKLTTIFQHAKMNYLFHVQISNTTRHFQSRQRVFQLGKTSSCRIARHVDTSQICEIPKWIDHVKVIVLVRQYLNVNWSQAQWGDDNEIYLRRTGAYPRTILLLIQNTVAYISAALFTPDFPTQMRFIYPIPTDHDRTNIWRKVQICPLKQCIGTTCCNI